jgi:molybdopterin/thiamine biosynthesis adenylyltransferase
MRFLAVAFEHAVGGEVNNSWEVGLEIDPSFWARVAKSSAREGLAVIPIHTHPGEAHLPAFSRRDRQGELALQPVLERRTGQPSAAVVMGLNFDSVARFDERSDRALGRCRDVGMGPKDDGVASFDADLFARHIAAFGAEGQRRLRALTVGVVGASGTGSHVCEQLSRLGVGRLVVVDPDSVELVNLNRIVTAFASDAGSHRSKVQAVKRYVKRAGTGCEVEALQGDVRDESVHKRLIPVDALFGCTDTISSRAILNRIAIQHYVPYWDCGTEIASGGHLRAYGRVRVVLAGGPCLFCGGVINPDQLRIELLSPEARHEEMARGYIRDLNDAGAPAVVTLNGVVASLATTSFLRWAVGDKPIEPGAWVYRSYAGDVRREDVHRDPECPVCSRGARLGRADLEVKL